MAVVGLEQTFYSTPEDGGSVEVCVVVYMPDIDCPIKFSFNFSLSTDFSTGIAFLCLNFLQVMPQYEPALILFTSLQSPPWIIVQLLTQ